MGLGVVLGMGLGMHGVFAGDAPAYAGVHVALRANHSLWSRDMKNGRP